MSRPVGGIAHGDGALAEPAGGGAVVAAQLARLAGSCDLFTVLGERPLRRPGARPALRARRLGACRARGGDAAGVHARRPRPRADDHDDRAEAARARAARARAATTRSSSSRGTSAALRSARSARFLAATPRESATLLEGGVPLDLLVGSASDAGERYDGGLEVSVLVATEGARRRGRKRRSLRGRAPLRGRSPTPTAPAIRSPRRSVSRSPAATSWRPRSGSPRAPARRSSRDGGRSLHK